MAGDAELVVEPATAPAELESACQRFVVVQQEVELDINFRDKAVTGVSTMHIFSMVDDLEEVLIDARQCEIDLNNITVDGYRTTATFSDPYDLMEVPAQWQLGALQHHIMKNRMRSLVPDRRPDVPITEREQRGLGCVPADGALKVSLRPEGLFKDEPRRALKIKTVGNDKSDLAEDPSGVKISIPFRSTKIRDGLHFVGIDEGDLRYPHVYTRHSIEPGTASCMFPCVDDPSSRHPWKISIKCPRTLGDALGLPLATQANGTRKRKHGEQSPVQQQSDLAEEDKLMEMTVICSGNLMGEQIDPLDERKKSMTFECSSTVARHIGFAIGPFEHVSLWSEFRTEEADEKLGANAAKIHGYCLPGRSEELKNTCVAIVAAADYFALEFGRYPFDSYKICFVEDMVDDTVSANSMSFCSTRLLYPEDIVEFEIENTRKLVHAMTCQYLGVHIIPNQRSDSWLVVGIQWFMTDLFMKTICGMNWYKFMMKTMADKVVETDVGRPSLHDLGNHLHLGEFEMDFMALKAPLVLYILDQRMSKVPGSTGVARVLSQMVSAANISNLDPRTTSVAADDFYKACEKKSQYRLHDFWSQWVVGAGCPRLLVKQRFNKKNLNVDISITQTQASPRHKQPQMLTKDEFWREYQEEIHGVYAGEVQDLFTGPFTVRIHEADGTPYEHYLDIREDDKDGTSWSIPYNTKYKRLKRTKKRDGANPAANVSGKQDIQDDDVVFFAMFGDVLTSGEDEASWGLRDWSPEMQNAMDQESYEWIRFDCNFEWLCDITTDMPGYMYLAQLQQDKDVVAHQDAMLYLQRAGRHDMAATIETRTLYDRRYYHGIRTMAVQDLPKHATPDLNYIGTAQLILMFRHFFCTRVTGKSGAETLAPAPNDFSDKAQYYIQCAIPAAIARTRENGRCSKIARNFLLDLLLFNNNSNNDYSDHVYIARLLEALTISLIPEKLDGDRVLVSTLKLDDDDDLEFKRFIDRAIDEIDKYRRMDEWTLTYQNIWTTTALDCKMRLMKSRVIPTATLDFVQYLQDENLDLVRIKAIECLVDLGMLAKPTILKLFLSYMSTDESPFVRHRLFRGLCRGIAAIALGEQKPGQQPATPEAEEDDGGLVIEQGDTVIEERKRDAIRQQDITSSLAALKEELKNNRELAIGIWKAFMSDTIGLREKQQILELIEAMFEPRDELLLTFSYPKRWKVTRDTSVQVNGKASSSSKRRHQQSLVMHFTSYYKTTPKTKFVVPELPPPPPVPEAKPLEVNTKKIKLSRPSISSASTVGPVTPSLLVPQGSISVAIPLGAAPVVSAPPTASDSISVQPAVRLPSSASPAPPLQPPLVATPAAVSPAVPLPRPATRSPSHKEATPTTDAKPTKAPKKRKSDDPDDHGSARPRKQTKIAAPTNRRIVKLPFTNWDGLRADTLSTIRAEQLMAQSAVSSTIFASPAHRQRPAPSSSPPTISGSPAPVPGSGPALTPAAASTTGSQVAVSTAPASAPAKPRKQLPSSAPSAAAAAGTAPNGAGVRGSPAAATPPAAAAKKITLKLVRKPSVSQSQ